MSKTDAMLIQFAVAAAEVENGLVDLKTKAYPALSGLRVSERNSRSRDWSIEEEEFLRANLGRMTEGEIGAALGRTAIGVHLHWKRDMLLTAPSKAADVITAQKAADQLGIDGHKLEHWVDVGLIPGRLMAGGRTIRLIQYADFIEWACTPQSWVYFNPRKVQDAELKKRIRKAHKAWGDEWWTTRRVADHHGVGVGDVKRYIHMGRIKSFRLPVSLGGRHAERRWSFHYVLKSEAVKVKFVQYGPRKRKVTQ